jgi:hypothetical protein
MKNSKEHKIPSWLAPTLVAISSLLAFSILWASTQGQPQIVVTSLIEIFKATTLLLVALLGGYVFSSVLEKQKNESARENTILEQRLVASKEI